MHQQSEVQEQERRNALPQEPTAQTPDVQGVPCVPLHVLFQLAHWSHLPEANTPQTKVQAKRQAPVAVESVGVYSIYMENHDACTGMMQIVDTVQVDGETHALVQCQCGARARMKIHGSMYFMRMHVDLSHE